MAVSTSSSYGGSKFDLKLQLKMLLVLWLLCHLINNKLQGGPSFIFKKLINNNHNQLNINK